MEEKTKNIIKQDGSLSTTLKNMWLPFIVTILNPYFLLTMVAICFSFYFQIDDNNRVLRQIFSVIIGVCSGFIGWIIKQNWTKYNDMSLLTQRGIISIRGLMVLRANIKFLLERSQGFLQNMPDFIDNNHKAIITRDFEDICSRAKGLIIETKSSIDNWNDILPFVQSASEASEQKIELEKIISQNNYTNKIYHNMIMGTINSQNEKEKEKLKKEIKENEEKIDELTKSISILQKESGPLMTSTGLMSSGSLYDSRDRMSLLEQIGRTWHYRCNKCNTTFVSVSSDPEVYTADEINTTAGRKAPRCSHCGSDDVSYEMI